MNKTASEIKTKMAEQGARDALFELRNLYDGHARVYGRIYREDVAEVVDKASHLAVLLCDVIKDLEPRPTKATEAEADGSTTPAPAPGSPVELHNPTSSLELTTRGAS